MSDPSKPSLASKLLNQDKFLQSRNYEQHRMQLEQQLFRAEWREKWIGRVIVVALILALTGMFLSGSRAFGSPDPSDKDSTVLAVAVGTIHILATIVFWLSLASWVARIRPSIKRTRELLVEESIREVRQEVGELRQQLMIWQQKLEGKP